MLLEPIETEEKLVEELEVLQPVKRLKVINKGKEYFFIID